ncbi:asparaginase [Hoeflea poritis]|uniref:Asparaginase n=1 Tax=Hoeflea poritis TaxID=2993659 RepID=A0ABT4VQE3_9HYPH|nr:asparaginase [Hoeflea poritis]MDA4846914.1 asparaginase [Hoeflea poritis]
MFVFLPLFGAPATASDSAADTSENKKAELPRVAIVTTGGTIAEKVGCGSAGAVPAVSGSALVQSVPGLSDIARIEVTDLMNEDSSQMKPSDWLHLHCIVRHILDREEISGVVVTHGTDTMAEAAFLLDVLLTSNKPVVFTGAMRTASDAGSDGPGNLLNAVRQVLLSSDRNWGVTVTLNGYINAARSARKTQTTNVQTFTSGEKGYLGYLYDGQLVQFNQPAQRVQVELTGNHSATPPYIPILKDYSGSDGRFIRHALETGAQGIVVEGVGAGNVNRETYQAMLEAKKRGLPVVIATRVPNGSVEPVYGDEGGGAALKKAGVILAGDLPAEKARLLLMVGLMRYGNDPGKLNALFGELYR